MHGHGNRTTWKPKVIAAFAIAAMATGPLACAEMRQNMRGEFVSYRGAYFCPKAGCELAQMQRSTQATRQGDLTVNFGKVSSGAALVFSSGKAPKELTAKVADCNGKSADVPADAILAPGSHGLAGQSDAYVVRIDPKSFPDLRLDKSCKQWTVTTHATWDKSTWDQKGAIASK
jgi:hypothetical protein